MASFLELAIEEALLGVQKGEGGPFGAVIVYQGEVIAKGHNQVVLTSDPTAHAEIVAIRHASQHLKRFDLHGCELYTSCEPCPMCMAAIYWARIDKVIYASTRHDAQEIGFDDNSIYQALQHETYPFVCEHTPLPHAKQVMQQWFDNPKRLTY